MMKAGRGGLKVSFGTASSGFLPRKVLSNSWTKFGKNGCKSEDFVV